ncbi:hypothetical protein F4779DRAFT_606065 [Xylariaceae sp. FL0662B]|nr:hypothetical protein F4779DRAFT_606065 [Xylariaceae sp. FL0662B]
MSLLALIFSFFFMKLTLYAHISKMLPPKYLNHFKHQTPLVHLAVVDLALCQIVFRQNDEQLAGTAICLVV